MYVLKTHVHHSIIKSVGNMFDGDTITCTDVTPGDIEPSTMILFYNNFRYRFKNFTVEIIGENLACMNQPYGCQEIGTQLLMSKDTINPTFTPQYNFSPNTVMCSLRAGLLAGSNTTCNFHCDCPFKKCRSFALILGQSSFKNRQSIKVCEIKVQ